MRYVPAEHPWAPLSVPQVIDLLATVPGRWWLSGGWALEEHVGSREHPSREHGDIDVTVAREHWPAVHAAVRERLQVLVARNRHLHDTATTPVDEGVRNLWARPLAGGPFQVQLNLEDISGGWWTYRRDRRVTRPVAQASWWSGRCWCIAPAVQMLWKAAAPREVDEQDYALVVPSLPARERAWLGRAVRLAHPDSPWVGRPDLDPE